MSENNMPIESSETRKRKNSSQFKRGTEVLEYPTVRTQGFTEELVLHEAYRTLNRLQTPARNHGVSDQLIKRFRTKIHRVEGLPAANLPAIIRPEPHLLKDVTDAAYYWCDLVGDRLRLVYMELRDAEHPDREFPGFPRTGLEEARGDSEAMQEVMGVVLTLSLRWQSYMDTWGHTLEEMTEGLILRSLLETALPVDEWIEARERIMDASTHRYRVVRDLYDAVNHLRRTARDHKPRHYHLLYFNWMEYGAYLARYLELN